MKLMTLLGLFFAVCTAQDFYLSGLSGEDVRYCFSFAMEAISLHLCREPCEPRDTLLKVHGQWMKTRRYQLHQNKEQVSMTIYNVTKKDAGFYRLEVASNNSKELHKFELKVKDLCQSGVNMDKIPVYWGKPGSDLPVLCELSLQLRDRKFLCRDECTTFLINAEDEGGYSADYGLEVLNSSVFKAIFRNLSTSDSGQYRCGVMKNDSSICQEFTIRVGDETLPVSVFVGLKVASVLLLGVILTVGVVLIRAKRKLMPQPGHNVNTNANAAAGPGGHHPQRDGRGVQHYASLNPETRESAYNVIQYMQHRIYEGDRAD